MKKLTVYDPAMCCSTGTCGNDVDPELVQFASDIAWLKAQGCAVERFNLAQQPVAFTTQPQVREALTTQGNACLPLILVDDQIMTRSIYPNREQLATLAGLGGDTSCCDDDDACCGGSETSTCC